jgi:hypothetical protein
VYSLGSSASWFSTVYATAIQSYYADFAERFAADAAYEPGTVVEIGGEQEVTLATDELSDSVLIVKLEGVWGSIKSPYNNFSVIKADNICKYAKKYIHKTSCNPTF